MINTRITDNRVQILSLANQHGIKSMKIFGSMARGDASKTSDADFLVEMEDGYDLFDLGSCLMELQDLLHCKVDMVTRAALHPRIRENILKEAQCFFKPNVTKTFAPLGGPRRFVMDIDNGERVEIQKPK